MNSCTLMAPIAHLRFDVGRIDLAIAGKSSMAGLRRSDRRSHRAELPCLAPGVVEGGAGVGVDEVALLYVRGARMDQQAHVRFLLVGPGDSPGQDGGHL